MRRIKEEAHGWIESDDPEYEWNASWSKAGKRIVILLNGLDQLRLMASTEDARGHIDSVIQRAEEVGT